MGKFKRKRWLAGAMAFVLCCSSLTSTGTFAVSAEAEEEVAQEAGLTKRETEVTALLLEGRSLRIVQQELFISEGTARTHAKRIYAKLGVHSKQELIDLFTQGEE